RFDRLPPHLGNAAQRGMEAFQASGNLRHVDITVDNSEHQHRLALAYQSSNQFLINLLKLKADVHNILTLCRVKWLGEGYRLFESAALGDGFLEEERLRSAFQEPWEAIPSRFAVTPYAQIIEAGSSDLATTGSFSRLEKAADDYMMGFLKLTKTVTFGLEPLVAYLLVRESEMKSIRMIMVGKLYRIPAQRIKERLPITF
ncbi:MAG: V-type ATPase subunit, partial [bacterium]